MNMATLIPSFSSCSARMMPGERRFAHRLGDKLEDDYLCWFDVPVGPKSQHPDFLILHPQRGLLVLEVKDWKLDTIQSATRASFTILTNRGQKVVANPFEQARQYAHTVSTLLEKDPSLTTRDEKRYQNRLCFPYGYGVVLANITRKAFDSTDLGEVIEPSRVICQDEMYESVEPEAFQARLWAMFQVRFSTTLSMPQVERIRWHLFPEVRINTGQPTLIDEGESEKTVADQIPELLRVMDLQQEQLARSLGDGHRVIHGVAGSGKTLILGYRAERLASALQKPVLVLCYNSALSAKIGFAIKKKNLGEQVHVRTFHAWCLDQLRLYHIELPDQGAGYFDALPERVIQAVERGRIPRAQYGAVMVDEGHDFQPEWFQLIAQMVDPETNSVLVLYDDAQSIYGRARRKFSFSSVGIQAQGRTTILRLNYRNTTEVLAVAYEFAKEFLKPEEAEDDGVPLIQPQSAGRHGPLPFFEQVTSLQAEVDLIAKRLIELHREGRPWREMAVIYRSHFIGEEVAKRLRIASIPVDQQGKGKRKFQPGEDSVKVMTIHSSKGLEFPVVAIPGLGFMPNAKQDVKDEAKLLYVGMTRAMDHLMLTCHKDSAFVNRIKGAVHACSASRNRIKTPVATPVAASQPAPKRKSFGWFRRPS
jgi:UvrD-like helicase C-terminal domain/Nuclease-related domain/AAA domain